MGNKRPQYSEKTLKEIANVLLEFCFIKNEETIKTVHDLMKRYGLCEDPYTLLPCSPGEYGKLHEKYIRDLMVERFGYYED